jgi:hypothetical protein
MSGIIAVYALVVSVLIAQGLNVPGDGGHYGLFTYVGPVTSSMMITMLTSFHTGASCTSLPVFLSACRVWLPATPLASSARRGCAPSCPRAASLSAWF